MRWLLIVLLALAVGRANAADLACDPRPGGASAYGIQWAERGELWGARLIMLDPKWDTSWVDQLVFCETCTGNQIHIANLGFRVGDPTARDVDKETSPESLAKWMTIRELDRGAPAPPSEFRSNSDPVPITIAGLQGKGRKIGIRFSDGRSYEAVMIFVSDGCLALAVVARARNGQEIPLDRIGEFASAIGVERCGPRPDTTDTRPPDEIRLLEQLQHPDRFPDAGCLTGN
jgi:hypothetical protein